MAKLFMRVDLSTAGDFMPAVLVSGVPLLDKWGNQAALLANWLGRFAAVVEWDDQTLECSVVDDEGVQLEPRACEPVTASDLGSGMSQELEELRSRLSRAVPPSESARMLHGHVSQILTDIRAQGEAGGRKHQLFKYRDLQGDWRLVYCPGFVPTNERASWTPRICQNASCCLLTLVDRSGSRPCPRCGHTVQTRSWLSRYASRLAAILLLLLLAAGAVFFYTRPDATLEGRVVRAIDGEAIGEAEVAMEGTSHRTVTERDGSFRLRYRRLLRRPPELLVSAAGFVSQTVQQSGTAPDSDVEVRLTGSARLLGKVVYAMGGEDRPITGASVSLIGWELPSVTTDASGGFRYDALPPVPVRLHVSAAGFGAMQVESEGVAGTGPPLRIELEGDGSLTGQVVLARDETIPIPEAEVSVEGMALTRTRSGDDGRFVLNRIPPSPIQVWAVAPGYRRIAVVAETLTPPLRIPLAGDATLLGSVTRGDTGEPAPGAAVGLHETVFQTRTDDAGRFRLDGVPSGTARIHAALPGLSASLTHELPAHQESVVAIELIGEAAVHGRILGAVDRQPVAGAAVSVVGTRLQTTTDSQGRFHLRNIPVSTAPLQVAAPAFIPLTVDEPWVAGEQTLADLMLVPAVQLAGQVVRAIDGQPVPEAGVVLAQPRQQTRTDQDGRFTFSDVPQVQTQVGVVAKGFRTQVVSVASDAPPLQIRLVGDATLSGQVVRSDTEQPAAGAEVVLVGTPFAVQADEQGRFRLEGVCSGAVQIEASLPGLAANLAKQLPADRETTVEMVLVGGANIRGRVVHAEDGRPVIGATIAVAGTHYRATADGQGQYELPGIPVGPATLQARADGYLGRDVTRELATGEQAIEVVLHPAAMVSGRVFRALDGAPLPNAKISVDSHPRSTRTDRQGEFTFPELPVQRTRFHIEASGYKPQEVSWPMVPGPQQLEELELIGDTPLTGEIRDAEPPRQAIPNARIEVRVSGHVRPLSSDAQGGFTVGDVPSGTVEITAQAAGYRDAQVRVAVSPDEARVEIPMTRLITVHGQVVEADGSRRAIPDAAVSVNVDGMTKQVKAGPDGRFSVDVPPGLATASAVAEGFCNTRVEKRLSTQDRSLIIPLLRGTEVRGTVLNAITGQPLNGATVKVTAGEVQQTGRTGADGEFHVPGIPVGDASIVASAPGFETDQRNHRTGGSEPLRIVLSPVLPDGEVRIVLTWGARPRDLDAHLYGPLPDGGQFHVGFQDLQAGGATLDVDAKEGWGPETITARNIVPGTFLYYVVHNDSLGTNEGQGIARSEAQVRVYYRGAPQRPYLIPPNASGPVWHALNLQVAPDGQITVVPQNQFFNDLPEN